MKAAEVHGARAEFCCRSGAVGAMKAAEVHGARAGFCCRSGAGGTAAAEAATGAAVEAATGAAAKVTAAAVGCGSVRSATEVAVVNGAWAECSGRSGAGGTAAVATGAAVEAATRAAVKVTAAAVCCGSVRGATEVAVVNGAWAECSGRSGAGGTAAAATGAAVESCASWSRRAAISEQERKSGAILFLNKFIRALLALANKVAVGELVAIEVLMYTTVRSIKDGEREVRQASNMDFIGGEARGGANGVVIGIIWCSLQTMANV